MTARPDKLVVVVGTATEIGKTWATAEVARRLRTRGLRVAARKPAQSFDDLDEPTDADVLGAASGEEPLAVCPEHRWYPVAMAPPMAAARLGRAPVLLAELVEEIVWPEGCAIGFVETAGGVGSPQCEDGDAVDLVQAVAPDTVVLVADAGLGTIGAVRLSVAALERAGIPVLVLLNRFDPDDELHGANRDWLVDRDAVTVCTSVETLVERLAN